MSPTDRARDHKLLNELTRISNDYGVLQREAQRDLARSRHELAEARDVLGIVAHDLRTPLQAVIGFAEFLLEEDLAPEQRDLAERIAHSGRLMADLTEDLLRTLTGRDPVPRTEPVDVASLLTELAAHFNLLAARADALVLEQLSAPDDIRVAGDSNKLRRALENLITNAVKFSPPGSTVRITAARTEDAVEIRITDDGPGIDPAEHDAVFAPFHRAPGSAPVPGVGLGLSIVKQIVEQHGGTVSIDSRPDEGATFVVRLPGA